MTDRVQDRHRVDLLIEAGLALASERSLESVLQRIVELAVDTTVARYGAISVFAPDGRIYERRAEAAAYLARHTTTPGSVG